MGEGYDVVVIGAGNGGLTASTTLAQKGLKVLLLERHNIPGGAATSFCRGRFEFEVALHQLSGMGTPDKPGPLRQIFGELGVMDDLEFVEMSDLYCVCLPDGSKLALKPDLKQVVGELQGKYPHEKEAIKRFFDMLSQFANDFISAFVFRDPEASREKYPTLYRYAFRNVKEVVDEYISDPWLKAVLSVYWGYLGVPPTRMAFAYLAMIFINYVEFKPFHVKGGSQAMSNALVNKFLSYGGAARFNCAARKIEVEGGAVKAVVTEHDEFIPTRFVISNAPQLSTYAGLIEPGFVPEEIFREMRGRKISVSAFTMFAGLDCEPGEIGITESTNFLLEDSDITNGPMNGMRRVGLDDELLVLSCYDVADPGFSPPGTCQVNVVTLKYGEPWLRIPPSQYNKVKYASAEAMLKRVEKTWPGFRSHIEEVEVGTPLTHMRYLDTPYGAVYGYEQLTKDSLFFQPDRYSPINGLFFAGGWAGDCGFEPTLTSGHRTAKSVLRQIGA